jgi:preprotein translocase subunit SecG
MYLFLVVLHVILCVFLVLIILLQPGKGGDVGAAFGGGSSTSFFGPRGPATLLSQGTTVVAVLFMVTSISLSVLSKRSVGGDGGVEDAIQLLQEEANKAAPVEGALPAEQPTIVVPAEDAQ